MVNLPKIAVVAAALVAGALAPVAHAANIFFETDVDFITPDQDFLVQVLLDAEGEPVNAFEGEVSFPAELVEPTAVFDGDSSVNLWVERPALAGGRAGAITFSGVTVGGVSGSRERLFSIAFHAKGVGAGAIGVSRIRLLQNDGAGTEAAATVSPLPLSVVGGWSGLAPRDRLAEDVEAPEDFVPVLASDPNIFDGRYFLAFATQDKASGVDRYEVREGWWGPFVPAESPHLLERQALDVDVHVKAIDRAGNERLSTVSAAHPSSGARWAALAVILLAAAVWLATKLWSRIAR